MTSADSSSSSRGSMPAVSAHGLGFTYERSDAPALSGADLEIPRGFTVAVVGASGAGKSTLCLTMNGLAPRFVRGRLEGDLTVLGVRMGDVPVHEMASRVGIVLQDFEAQLFSTSAELEVAFGLENLGVEPGRMRDLVTSSLRAVGLEGFEKRDPGTLSGGEKQRLALAAVLAMEPAVLVLDEPTSDLDPRGRRDVMAIVAKLAGRGRSVVVVEHETDELLGVDLVVALRNGKVMRSGRPEDVFSQCREIEAAGVRPPQLAELSTILGLDTIARNLDSAEEAIRAGGFSVDEKRVAALPVPEIAGQKAPVLIRAQSVSYTYSNGGEESRLARAEEVPAGVARAEGAIGGRALDDVSLEIRRGEFVAVLGVNGSGKTTLVKHFNGLLHPLSGSVEIDGMDTREAPLSVISKGVGYVFQNPDHQIFCDTVADELAFGPKNAGVARDGIRRRSERALRAVRLEGCEEKDPFALTKGERQRVALASVLVMEPSVIVMDEPTTGLDYLQQRKVMGLLRELNAAGHTIVIVTHSLWLAAQYSRRTMIMHEGRIVADGPTRRVMCAGNGLERWSLASPPAIALGRRLGVPALTVRELAWCLGADLEPEGEGRTP